MSRLIKCSSNETQTSITYRNDVIKSLIYKASYVNLHLLRRLNSEWSIVISRIGVDCVMITIDEDNPLEEKWLNAPKKMLTGAT